MLKVFMIMPFNDDFLGLYEHIKGQFPNYKFEHAGDLDSQQSILKDIIEGIYQADVIVADLTGLNPNVFYELGICHALGKKVIIIIQDIDDLPFDIRPYRTNQYSPHVSKVPTLIDTLEKLFNGAENGTTVFGNPVSDFTPKAETTQLIKIKQESESTGAIANGTGESEKGFLDFIVEIQEDLETVTSEIEEMTSNLGVMNEAMNYGTEEISRVQKSGGSGNVSFTRGVARKVAEAVNVFDSQMKDHNTTISDVWMRVENNFLDLIDNKFMDTDDNKEDLIKLLKLLYSMQTATIDAHKSTVGMIESFSNIRGIERRLNQATNSLEYQMNTYLAIMDNMIASIDRIIEKSKKLVGDIDFNNN